MRVSVQRLRGVLIVVTTVTAAGLAGCDKSDGLFRRKPDAGLDAAGDGDAEDDDAGSEADAGYPVEYLPGKAGTHVDAAGCGACQQTECAREAAACIKDPACVSLACLSHAIDPVTHLECEAQVNAALPGEQRLADPVSSSTMSLETCRQQNCGSKPGEPCETHDADAGVGPTDCVGAYDWPASWTERDVSFSMWIRNANSWNPIANLIVRLCSSVDQDCVVPADEEVTDEEGMVWLRYDKPLSSTIGHYLEIRTPTGPSAEPGPDDIRNLFFPDSPDFVDGVAYYVGTSTFSESQEIWKMPVPDADRGGIAVTTLNCWRIFQGGLTLTDSAADAPATIAFGLPIDLTLTATPNSNFSLAWVLNARAGEHELALAREDTGTVFSRRRAFVRPGWVSLVNTAPLTRSQQAELDP